MGLLSTWRLPQLNINRSLQYILLIGLLFLSSLVLLVMLSVSLRPRIAVVADFWGLPILHRAPDRARMVKYTYILTVRAHAIA